MRTVTDDERTLRKRLVDIEIRTDAMRMYPLTRDLGWQRLQLAVLDREAARLRQAIAIHRHLGETA